MRHLKFAGLRNSEPGGIFNVAMLSLCLTIRGISDIGREQSAGLQTAPTGAYMAEAGHHDPREVSSRYDRYKWP
jgi:hypothetical protein